MSPRTQGYLTGLRNNAGEIMLTGFEGYGY